MNLLPRVWQMLRRDIGRKLTALALALLLWGTLENFVVDDRDFALDVRWLPTREAVDRERAHTPAVYLVVPDDLIVRKVDPPRMNLRVKGLRDDVAGLSLSAALTFSAADLGDDDEREFVHRFTREDFKSSGEAPQLTDFRVRPETLTVTLARRATIEVTLTYQNVTLSGRPKDGYFFRNNRVSIRPNTVRITGPRSVVEPMLTDPLQPPLAPVNVSDKAVTVSQVVGLPRELLDQGVSLLTTNGQVEVTIPIEPEDEHRDIFRVPVIYLNQDALASRGKRVVSSPETLDVRVTGPPLDLRNLTDDRLLRAIYLSFDWRNYPESFGDIASAKVDVALDQMLPSGLRVTDLNGEALIIEYMLEDLPPAGGP
ncbi:MAG: YbbR-like domain-containing protein [Planctomycetota bacterium]|jgi:hypothetical protein